MKIFELLKKPIKNYTRNNNQKQFILESDYQTQTNINSPTTELAIKKKQSISLKSSKRFLYELVNRKKNFNESISKARNQEQISVTSQNSDDESNSYHMCFDNYAYGNFLCSEIDAPYSEEIHDD